MLGLHTADTEKLQSTSFNTHDELAFNRRTLAGCFISGQESTDVLIWPSGEGEFLGNDDQPALKRQRLTASSAQKSAVLESKLSSQLVRLESQIKSSVEDQGELLKKMDLIRQERLLKDERYLEMVGILTGEKPEMMEEILSKIAELL